MMRVPPGIYEANGRRRRATTGGAIAGLSRSRLRSRLAAWSWRRAGCPVESLALQDGGLRALFALDLHVSVLDALGTKPVRGWEVAARGLALLATGRTGPAIADLTQAVRGPADFGLWLRAASSLALLDPARAAALIGTRHREAPAALLLAHLAERSGDPDRAAQLLAGIRLDGKRAAEGHLLAANIAMARGEPAGPAIARAFAFRGAAPQDGPKVSIIVAAHDAERTIAAALESLTAQSWKNIEILVVDDASRDATLAQARRFAERDARIRVLPQAVNRGAYVARNAGAAATGAFVAFHDADDTAHPERIARQMAPLLDDDTIAFTTARWARREPGGRFRCRQLLPLIRLHVGSMLIRRPFLEAVGTFDPVRFGADGDMLLRLQVAAGPNAFRALDLPLTIGGYDPGSAVHDPVSGYGERGFSLPRLAYREGRTRDLIARLKKDQE